VAEGGLIVINVKHSPHASAEYLHIGEKTPAELEHIMLRGQAPSLAALAGWEWRGLNTMFWAPTAGIKKFVKGFYKADDGVVYGYNEPVVQNRLDQPWIAKPSDVAPKRFGFFSVEAVEPTAVDNAYLGALLLDYGKGKNPALDPSRVLRDYLVRVHPGSDDLLLGCAFAAVGPVRVRVPHAFFLLERHRATSFKR
jgi:hypothetical protein